MGGLVATPSAGNLRRGRRSSTRLARCSSLCAGCSGQRSSSARSTASERTASSAVRYSGSESCSMFAVRSGGPSGLSPTWVWSITSMGGRCSCDGRTARRSSRTRRRSVATARPMKPTATMTSHPSPELSTPCSMPQEIGCTSIAVTCTGHRTRSSVCDHGRGSIRPNGLTSSTWTVWCRASTLRRCGRVGQGVLRGRSRHGHRPPRVEPDPVDVSPAPRTGRTGPAVVRDGALGRLHRENERLRQFVLDAAGALHTAGRIDAARALRQEVQVTGRDMTNAPGGASASARPAAAEPSTWVWRGRVRPP